MPTSRGSRKQKRESISSSSTQGDQHSQQQFGSRRRERSLSRHQRNSISSNSSSAIGVGSQSIYSNVSHVDENETEMFSGAAANVIPTAVSSFHHHNHELSNASTVYGSSYRSPSLHSFKSPSVSGVLLRQGSQGGAIEELNLDDVIDNEDGGELNPVDSNVSFADRANFRFFTTQEIEDAKGVSTFNKTNNNGEVVDVDYDTNWNTYEDDYSENELDYQNTQQQYLSRLEGLSATRSSTGYGSISGSRANTPEYDDNGEDEYSSRIFGEDDEDIKGLISAQKADIDQHDKLFGARFPAENHNQRFYIAEEDLVVGIAGYRTSKLRLMLYYISIVCSFGLGYLALRWLPRYRIKMMGDEVPLGKAEWVVVEDEFGVLDIQHVDRQWYNKKLSSFLPKKPKEEKGKGLEEEDAAKHIASQEDTFIYEDGLDPIVPILISFEYRYMVLFYDPVDDLYRLANNWIDEKWCYYPEIKEGITEETFKSRKMIFGENLINIKEKSIIQLLTDEILHPFYVFQIFSIMLWMADDYYYYAFCIFIISLFSVADSLVETRKTMERMRHLSKFQCNVRVWRSGFWTETVSDNLVPGDIYEVSDPSLSIFPCDSILLSGDCIVNEAMLTGESVPVSKVPISTECAKGLKDEFNSAKFSNSLSRAFLYNGTKIVRCRYGTDNELATALVVRTGFNTTKGALVRSMLFPKPSGFKFYEDSFKYIGVMFLIACIGFIFSTVNFIKLGLGWKVIIFRALDLITIVVPPALPATLTIGTSFALSRLRKKNIFCIAPTRVNVGGKLDVMCFDKTGTLTEEGLDIMGVHVSQPIRDRKAHEFSEMKTNANDLIGGNSGNIQAYSLFLSMLTCHSLKLIENELCGDPLDYKMFQFTDWDMVEDSNKDSVLSEFVDSYKVPHNSSPILFKSKDSGSNADSMFVQLKEYEFISQLRRMSVITQSLSNPLHMNVFVKGAPEVMESLCFPGSLPSDYEEFLHKYTHNGYRVIACATKTLKVSSFQSNPKDFSFLDRLSREKVESELEFIGFIIFENRLKDSSKGALGELNDAEIRTIMCTGDNVLTAISVGRESELIKPNSKVYISSFNYDEELNIGEGKYIPPIIWTEVDNSDLQLDAVTMAPLDVTQDENYCIAVTGDIFKFMLTELADMEFLIEKMLMKGAIFARMSPDEKHELVDRLKGLDYTVGFCGDGANDCGALKAADVGISLSEAEASVAAPFTSRAFEISCVLDVIKEGRASLVTSFSCFQYMSLYSAIQFVTVSFLYKEGTNLGDFQFLYVDLCLIIPIAVFMSWSEPYHRLCVKKSTANLISPKIIIPLLGNILVIFCFQLSIYRYIKEYLSPLSWYAKPVPGDDDAVKSTDNTLLFLYANYQYILIALMLTVGPPYREPATSNHAFIITIITTLAISTILMFVNPDTWFGDLMDLTWISGEPKFIMILASAVNYGALEFGDKFLFLKVARFYKKIFGKSGSKKKFKNLKREFKSLGCA